MRLSASFRTFRRHTPTFPKKSYHGWKSGEGHAVGNSRPHRPHHVLHHPGFSHQGAQPDDLADHDHEQQIVQGGKASPGNDADLDQWLSGPQSQNQGAHGERNHEVSNCPVEDED